MLRVDMEDFEGDTAYAEYNMFGVMNESEKYKMIRGSYSGGKYRSFVSNRFDSRLKLCFPY